MATAKSRQPQRWVPWTHSESGKLQRPQGNDTVIHDLFGRGQLKGTRGVCTMGALELAVYLRVLYPDVGLKETTAGHVQLVQVVDLDDAEPPEIEEIGSSAASPPPSLQSSVSDPNDTSYVDPDDEAGLAADEFAEERAIIAAEERDAAQRDAAQHDAGTRARARAAAQPSQMHMCPYMMCVVVGCVSQADVCAAPSRRRSAPPTSAPPTSAPPTRAPPTRVPPTRVMQARAQLPSQANCACAHA